MLINQPTKKEYDEEKSELKASKKLWAKQVKDDEEREMVFDPEPRIVASLKIAREKLVVATSSRKGSKTFERRFGTVFALSGFRKSGRHGCCLDWGLLKVDIGRDGTTMVRR